MDDASSNKNPVAYGAYLESPLGLLELGGNEVGITQIQFVEEKTKDLPQNTPIKTGLTQLSEYFAGTREHFTVPLAWQGTEFQKKVWEELLKIPYGTTITYHDLSLRLGDEKAIRAVGTANGSNPIAIIVPCHRVIGSDGKLRGYAYGLERKAWLLRHEGNRDFAQEQIALF